MKQTFDYKLRIFFPDHIVNTLMHKGAWYDQIMPVMRKKVLE
jgi:hypothetical protein